MRSPRLSADVEAVRLPQPPPAPITAAGFAMVPMGMLPGQCPEQWLWQMWVYQQCFEAAQAIARPSLPERDLLGTWN